MYKDWYEFVSKFHWNLLKIKIFINIWNFWQLGWVVFEILLYLHVKYEKITLLTHERNVWFFSAYLSVTGSASCLLFVPFAKTITKYVGNMNVIYFQVFYYYLSTSIIFLDFDRPRAFSRGEGGGLPCKRTICTLSHYKYRFFSLFEGFQKYLNVNSKTSNNKSNTAT